MSDVKVIRYLLANNAPLVASVAAASIFSGKIPQGSALPALCVTHVSGVRRGNVAGSAVKFCTARVQITVHAADYPQQKSILRLARAALAPVTRGTVNGVSVDSVAHESDGPDFSDDEAGIFMESVDYKVTFSE